MQGDIPASQMLNSLPGVDPARRDRLIDVLDINPNWRMHLVSGGCSAVLRSAAQCSAGQWGLPAADTRLLPLPGLQPA
jgi:hypothetical protein